MMCIYETPFVFFQLHHVGVPVSELIAPVTYMWRPYHLPNGENGGSHCNSDGCNESTSSESFSSHRQLWVLIHASAFNEGYDALKFACQKLVCPFCT